MTINAEQLLRSPRTAQVLRPAAGHEVVYGTTGSGKTTRVKKLLAEDQKAGREIWIIDSTGTDQPDWDGKAHRYARNVTEARDLLTELLDIARHDAWSRRPTTITIEGAQHMLRDYECRRLVERTLSDARGYNVRFRMVVQTLHLTSFGESVVIRSAVLGGAA